MDAAEDYGLTMVLGDRGIFARPEIERVQNTADLAEIYRLTHDSYVKNEYALPHPSNLLIHYPYFDHLPETVVLVARLRGKIVGTISCTFDGPSGLTIDEDFKTVCDPYRASGKRVSAVWRFVVDETHRHETEIATGLIREMILILKNAGAENWFFAVNPKHANFYKRMLNAEVVGEKPVTAGLRNAPSMLLLVHIDKLPRRIVSPDPTFCNPILIPVLLNAF